MNPKPRTDQLTPWKPGQSGNPTGLSKERKAIIDANADKALRIRAALLDQIVAKVDKGEAIRLDSETLNLVKQAEDRGMGAPKERVDVTAKRVATRPLTDAEWAAEHGATE
jgi:Family of unknown function (DUF5681)